MAASRPKRIRRRLSKRVRHHWYSVLRFARPKLRELLVRYAQGKPRRTGSDADRSITFVLASAWGMGGTIRDTHNVAGYLAETHDVEILSLVRRRENAFFGLPPGVRVTALDDMRQGAVPRYLERIRDYLTSKESLFMNPDDRPADSASLWMDIQLVRRLRGRTGFLIATHPGLNLVVAELSPPGTITIGKEEVHLRAHSPELQESIRELYPGLDALVVLTETDRERYDEHLGGALPPVVIPIAAPELARAKADLSASRVLAAGRLTDQKGFDMLIDAWADLAAAHSDWALRICGRGPLRRDLRRQVAKRALEDSIELPGARDIAEEIAIASIYVLSSRFEGFPLVLLEAMSTGMAVVAFDCPTGPGEIVRDRENGILVPDGDVDGLAAGIRAMIEDEELRRRCAAAAIETAKDYTWDTVGPKWHGLFEDLLAARRGTVKTSRVPVVGR